MSGLTRSLAEFVHAPGFGALPARAVETAQSGFIDTVATLIAGREEPVVGIVTRYVAARGSTASEATVLAGSGRAASADAALINGTAGHALDFDDVAMGGHPSTVLVPTVLAEAEALGLGGADAVRAYLVGYEVWSELFRREPDAYHLKGWHPTAVLGTVAAAAASAHLRGLPVDRARHALSLAGSFAAGLVANFGTMTKPLHAGRAAQSGIQAALWAQGGLEAGAVTLESPVGLMRALSPGGRVDLKTPFPSADAPALIDTLGLNIKKYPTVGASQRIIDSMLFYLARHPVDATLVVEAIPRVSEKFASVMPFHAPRTALEAKFSLEFVVAASLLRGKVGLAELSDDFVASEAVQSLMRRVRIERTAESDPGYPNAAPVDYVRLRLTDGRELRTDEIHRATGHADLPLGREQIAAKFAECAAAASISEGVATRLFEALQTIDRWRGTEDLPLLA